MEPPAEAGEGKPPLVLVVDDEESFVEALSAGLPREGFAVTVARDGIEALQVFDSEDPDLVLLDLMLPKMSGIDVCKGIRERSSTPIIMVTAKDSELDLVVGLELGADDYVTKPYRLRELVARMRAVLRRTAELHDNPTAATPSEALSASVSGFAEAGYLVVDTDSHRVFVGGIEVVLRRKEFKLLELLIRNAGKVLTRDLLIDRAWGADYVGDTKTLDVHIKRLRARLEVNPSVPKLITTIRGVGYRFEGKLDKTAPALGH